MRELVISIPDADPDECKRIFLKWSALNYDVQLRPYVDGLELIVPESIFKAVRKDVEAAGMTVVESK